MTRDVIGHGPQTGPLRPDWGDNWADLACTVCNATWTGPIGEPCAYCEWAIVNMQRWQAELLLEPDLPDRDDQRWANAVDAWADRLARAVDAGLVTAREARHAYERERRRRDRAA